MYVAGVVGPGSEAAARALASRLRERGPVARIRRGDATPDGGALLASEGADTSYVLDDDGARLAAPPRSLTEALDDLAPDHDYAVVTGYPDARVPLVVAGGGEFEGEVVARVRGDGGDAGAAVDAIEATEPHETLQSLVARVEEAAGAERAGAIATFTGRVRQRDGADDPETTHLEFETYEGVAEERMATIAEELEERDGVVSVLMHHRTGVVEAGEDIVFVVVLAGHRPEAFATVSDGIERLKAEVPIFKKEVTLAGEFWAHEGP